MKKHLVFEKQLERYQTYPGVINQGTDIASLATSAFTRAVIDNGVYYLGARPLPGN